MSNKPERVRDWPFEKFHLSDDDKRRFSDIADQIGKPKAQILRSLVRSFIKDHKK